MSSKKTSPDKAKSPVRNLEKEMETPSKRTNTTLGFSQSPAKKQAVASSNTGGNAPTKDQVFVTKIHGYKNEDNISTGGLVVHFLPNEAKTTNTGPYSAKLFDDALVQNANLLAGLAFEKTRFPLFINSVLQEYPAKNGIKYPGKSFVVTDIEHFDKITHENMIQFAEEIVKVVNERKKATFTNNTYDCVEVAKNFLVDDEDLVYADIIGTTAALKMLKYNYNKSFKLRPISAGFPEENEDTWGKLNAHVIDMYFNKNTLTIEQCVNLGLNEEYLLPELRNDSSEDDQVDKDTTKKNRLSFGN